MYLYIFEDNTLKQQETEPTQEDLQCIEDGILTIISCENGIFFNIEPDGSTVII